MRIKKYIAALAVSCILLLICSVCNAQSTALLEDTFEDTVTNSRPLKAHVMGDGSIVIATEYGQNNKILTIKNRWEDTTVYYDAASVDDTKFVAEVSFCINDTNSAKSLIQLSDDSQWLDIALVNANGRLVDSNGADTGIIVETGRFYTLSAAIDISTFTCSLYLDGVAVSEGKAFATRFDTLTKVGFTSYASTSADTQICYDYIRLYPGSDIIGSSQFPKAEYNHITKPYYRSEVIDADAKPVTLYNMDFDNFLDGDAISGIDKTAYPENQTVVTDLTDGNHYFHTENNTQTNILMWYQGKDFYPDTVIQADYRIPSGNQGSIEIMLRDIYDTGSKYVPVAIDKNGYFVYDKKLYGSVYYQQKVNNTSCLDSWVNMAIALHYRTKTLDVYINGVEAVSDVPFRFSDMSFNMYHIRYVAAQNSGVDIDNIYVYKSDKYYEASQLEGAGGELLDEEVWQYPVDTTPISPDLSHFQKVDDTVYTNPSSRLTDYAEAKAAYKDAVCLVQNSANLWIKDGKYKSEHIAICADGNLMAPAETLAYIYGTEPVFSNGGSTVTIGNMTASAGDDFICLNGDTVSVKAGARMENGVLYLPVEEFAIYVMKKWYGFSGLGFGVIADGERDVHFEADTGRAYLSTVSNTSHMMAYLILERPNASRLRGIIESGRVYEAPYVTYSQRELQQLKSLVESKDYAAEYSDLVIVEAGKLLNTEYTVTDVPGGETSPIFGENDVWTLYWAYQMTGNYEYVNKAEQMALMMANLSHWCADTTFLQTARAIVSASTFYDLFNNEFSDETKDTIARAILYKGLMPVQSYYDGSTVGLHNDWPTRCTNWNIIPNSAAIIGASTLLARGYDDTLCLEILERAFVSLGYAMHYFAPDGGGGEGVGYTNFILGYICSAIDSLNRVFGTDFGISDYPGFMNVGYYPAQAMSFKYAYTLNDDGAESVPNMTTSMWFANKLGDGALAKRVYDYLDDNGIHKRAYSPNVLKNCFEYDENAQELPLDALFNQADLAFSRDSRDETGVFLGVHSGYNNIGHGRYDYGTFEFDAFGIRFANECGGLSFEPSGFGSFVTNHIYYPARAEGHNVYVINPDSTPGQNRYTDERIKIQQKEEKGIIYTLDMLPAYSGYVKEAKRGYMLTNDRKVFVIQDEIVPFDNSYDDFYWFWHTYADIEIDNDTNTVVLTRDGKKVKLYFDCTTDVYLSADYISPLPSSPNPAGQLSDANYSNMKKITAMFFGDGEPVTLRVIAEPVGQSYPRGELVPISQWQISQDSMDEVYYDNASSIMLNSRPLPGFAPDVYDYTVKYQKSGNIPTVTAVSDMGTVSVTQATADGDSAVVRVESSSVPGNYKIYTITFIGSDDSFNIVGDYVDCDFEDYTSLDGNASTTKFFVYHNGGGISSFVTDEIRENNVLKWNILDCDTTGRTLDADGCVHMDNNSTSSAQVSNVNGIVLEFSFKAENYGKVTSTVLGVPLMEIGRDGIIYGIDTGEKVPLCSYKPGEWYNIKLIYDKEQKYYGIYAKLYMYINDTAYAMSASSGVWRCSYLTKNSPFPSETRFTLYANQSEKFVVYLDDIRLYTTDVSPYGKIDLAADFAGTQVHTEGYRLGFNKETGRNEIYVDEKDMISDILTDIGMPNRVQFDFYKNGQPVSAESYDTTPAPGTTIYVPGDTNRVMLPYDIVSEGATVEAEWSLLLGDDKKKIESLSGLKDGDKLFIKLDAVNDGNKEQTICIVFCIFSNDGLAELVVDRIKVAANSSVEYIVPEYIKYVASEGDVVVEAFAWDNLTNVRPLIKQFECF